jgi:hypothetical protein
MPPSGLASAPPPICPALRDEQDFLNQKGERQIALKGTIETDLNCPLNLHAKTYEVASAAAGSRQRKGAELVRYLIARQNQDS